MKLISHRGNINGPILKKENSPDYIKAALSAGFDVEIDVSFNNGWYLGHDKTDYRIDMDFLSQSGLWIHCKNIAALAILNSYKDLNYFWHQEDDYTLTSKGYIWTYPGKKAIANSKAIIVKPEINKQNITKFSGVCSDYIANYGD